MFMSESQSEFVSSLVDNYQQSDKLLDEVITDSDLSDTWNNYHLIGDIIRDELPQELQLDLSEQIADAIAQEPTILAPKTSVSVIGHVKAKIMPLMKPFGQVAIAASAAGLMILGVQTNIVNNETVIPTQVVQTVPLAGFADPVSFNYQTENRLTKKQAYVEQQRRFQALLFDHQQQVKLSALMKDKPINEVQLPLEKVEDSLK